MEFDCSFPFLIGKSVIFSIQPLPYGKNIIDGHFLNAEFSSQIVQVTECLFVGVFLSGNIIKAYE